MAGKITEALTAARVLSGSVGGKLTEAGKALGGSAGNFAGKITASAGEALGLRGHRRTPETLDYMAAHAEAQAEIGRINVLVAGNTGVGKSTLVNAIFGDAVAPTGAGLPVTQSVTLYEAPSAPLNLWDSRGFEAGDDEAVAAVDKQLDRMRRAGDANAQIHVAWLCISAMSKRVEPVHVRFLTDMAERNIPTVVVFTQSYLPMPLEARKIAVPAAAQIELLAEDEPGFDRRSFGLDTLVEATDALLPEARKAAFAAAQTVQWGLKKNAARKVVALAAAAAAGTAVAPGHSIVLSGIQIGMLVRIDAILGRDLMATDMAAVKIALRQSASKGGEWIFGALLGDGLKASGIGYAAGVAIGGAVGGAITSAMGLAYVEGLTRYAESGGSIDIQQLARLVIAATATTAETAREPILG